MSHKPMQVIKILDKFTVIINSGSNQGKLYEESNVAIYEPGPAIIDLDGNCLGNYDFTKAKLVITEVYPEFSIAKHLKAGPVFDLQKTLGGYSSNGPLAVDDKEVTPLHPSNTEIKIGDLVKRI
ncbi:hypothetical protein [Streptococcus suis]|uniref:hypothetical protein n=1 Tax=Streptococcus suis TaxID=1307 RepID=UPI000943BC3A|nr:hypothetical protein [Streptococcus suis]HEL1665530.1 hypothetical protein [Streptococcus suis]HEL1687472.1 hypothetical protein [Streptococcus suis]HEL2364482.1 hypothetical protein [Streptococcus suis]HEL2674049.1 hypothetical protein [Streptococcus suis]HEL2717744.1 hypothetical protein [Streptococcus suis]